MDDKIRGCGTEMDESPQKPSKRRRTPSADPSDRSDLKSKRRSRSRSHSRSKSSRSVSPTRDRGGRKRRSRSRGHYSPDRRFGRFNRGGFQQRDNFHSRRRRSPSRSPGFRGRNRNSRRSRSASYDRFRNRRNSSNSRDRSLSQGRRENSRPPQGCPQAPPAPNFPSDYAPTHFQPEYQPPYPSAPQYGNYDYVPIMQAPPTSFPPYPPPASQEYMWNTQIPPPPIISCAAPPEPAPVPTKPATNEQDEEQQKRQAAIAAEKKIQRDTIRKQRDDYTRRASALKRELITLKEQREELATGNEPPSPTTNNFIKENDRLQTQIVNKIGTIENVIEMLSGILSADKSDTESPKKPKAKPEPKSAATANSDDSSPERLKTKVMESLSKKRKDSERSRKDESLKSGTTSFVPAHEQINLTFFDPEQHWCKPCSSFPKTAKEYLLHMHSEEHKNNVKPPEIPWHDHLVKDDMPTYPNAPTKRTPIRGLQFFVPSTAWYCKLCSFWIGDLHCASTHLKSQTHSREYEKFIAKNPHFENEWSEERQKALDTHNAKAREQSQKMVAPPSPPIISAQKQNIVQPPPPPSMTSFGNASNAVAAVFDGIPLQINQRPKEATTKEVIGERSNEEVEKKRGKKKKKEKKKRKKSKKKHRHSSSSSSTSSDESSVEVSPERKKSVEKTIDTSTSIRVAMRNAVNAVPARAHIKPKSDDEDATNAGGWTVVQNNNAMVIPPKPPTISANGEAQNRRDEAIISQWTPLPVISEKEKKLFEQLKGKMKTREDRKKEDEIPQSKIAPITIQSNNLKLDETNDRSQKDKPELEKDFKEVRDKNRRDAYRKRRSRSPSTPRRDSRRSPRRDRYRRSRSGSPRRDRRSPRRDRRRDRYSRSKSNDRDRYSRSKSRDRRSDKNDSRVDKNSKNSDKSKPAAKKAASAANAGKKLPFIGRMPVFKKQTTEEELKKQEPSNDVNDEEKLMKQKQQEALKFQIQQKQQLLQLQQKQAEAYNLAHPGQFANIYNTHGTIHHILPEVQPEEYDLMPDPMQYANLMTPVPPPPMPMPEPETIIPHQPQHQPQVQAPQHQPHYEQESEPVLPPGIDEEEAVNMELEAAVPPPPPPSDKDELPKDFQDALSIIFDKGVEKPSDETTASAPAAGESENSNEIQHVVMQDDASNFAQMDISSMDSQHSQVEHAENNAVNMELDEQSQYMLYEEHYAQNHIQPTLPGLPSVPQASVASIPPTVGDLAAQNIPTPPIQIVDAAGNITQIPGLVLEVGSDFMMLDADGNRIIESNAGRADTGKIDNAHEIDLQNKRRQELDDLAMLGIDADDLAAQCI